MKNRVYIKDLKEHIDTTVIIAGWVDARRDHGKLIFIDLRDATGKIQVVASPDKEEVRQTAESIRPEWTVSVTGLVNKRPEKMIKTGDPNGHLELEARKIEILGKAKELPFDKEGEINIDTVLDYLPLTLRTEKRQAIFRFQTHIIQGFRRFLSGEGFTEIQAPKIIGDDAEGGANSFNIDYFGHTAHLAQSPQFYKQIMVGVFERVFAAGNVYRAEKHSTTRHLNEYTSLDFEMGFIDSFRDVMDMENKMLSSLMDYLKKEAKEEITALSIDIPEVSEKIPVMKLREAQKLIKEKTGEDCINEPDLEPAHERWLCDYSKKKLNSEFIFITHFPMSKRPMYTMEDASDKGYAAGFDLLFRGVEITTGSQRIHDYDVLIEAIKKKGLNPEKFSFYLQAFKYGMPPHGGLGIGLERLTAKIVGLENVKEATLFPRDLNRIDNLLSN